MGNLQGSRETRSRKEYKMENLSEVPSQAKS